MIKLYLFFFLAGLLVLLILLLNKIRVITKPPKQELFTIFKITNKSITLISIMAYYIIFIEFIFYLRVNRSNFSIDLNPVFEITTILIKNNLITYYCIIILLLLGLIFVFILKKLREYFDTELLKMHLFLMVSDIKNQKTLYSRLIFKMMPLFSINAIIRLFLKPLTYVVSLIKDTVYFPYGKYVIALLFKFLQKILDMKYNIFIMPSLIFYDMYYNAFVISLIFKFLPFYFIYTLWYQWNKFFFEENALENSNIAYILYDLYYNSDKIKYFHLEREKWGFIRLYIKLKLRGTDDQFNTDISALAERVIYYGRYTLQDREMQLYINENIPSQKIILKNYSIAQRLTILHELFLNDL